MASIAMYLMRNQKGSNTPGGDLMKLGHPFVHDHYLFRKPFSQNAIELASEPEDFCLEI